MTLGKGTERRQEREAKEAAQRQRFYASTPPEGPPSRQRRRWLSRKPSWYKGCR